MEELVINNVFYTMYETKPSISLGEFDTSAS